MTTVRIGKGAQRSINSSTRPSVSFERSMVTKWAVSAPHRPRHWDHRPEPCVGDDGAPAGSGCGPGGSAIPPHQMEPRRSAAQCSAGSWRIGWARWDGQPPRCRGWASPSQDGANELKKAVLSMLTHELDWPRVEKWTIYMPAHFDHSVPPTFAPARASPECPRRLRTGRCQDSLMRRQHQSPYGPGENAATLLAGHRSTKSSATTATFGYTLTRRSRANAIQRDGSAVPGPADPSGRGTSDAAGN